MEKIHQFDFSAMDEYLRTEFEMGPFTIDNLEPSTKYEFRVSAENRIFTGNSTDRGSIYQTPRR